MEETKLTGLLLSFFYEGSLLHETLMQKPNSKFIRIIKSHISDLHQERSPNHSEFMDLSNTIKNIVHRNQQNSLISWCQLGYSHLIVTVFRYILSLPFFIMRMSKIGDYLLTIHVPATEPNSFVRSDSLLCNQVTTDVLKTHPSPVLVLHLLRESVGKLLPSIELRVDVKLDGQNTESRKYGLQTIICLNSANELVTYIRQRKSISEVTWSIIKSREWIYFSKSELPGFERHLQLVYNSKDFECVQLEGLAEHSAFMMKNCLFLAYVPVVQEHVPETAACNNLTDFPWDNNSNSQENTESKSSRADSIPPHTVEILETLLFFIKSNHPLINYNLQLTMMKLTNKAEAEAIELSGDVHATNFAKCIDWSTETLQYHHVDVSATWNKLLELSEAAINNCTCIELPINEASCSIQGMYNSYTGTKEIGIFGLIISLRRIGLGKKLLLINTEIDEDSVNGHQKLQLFSVICYVQEIGVISYIFDAKDKCWRKKLPNGNVQKMQMMPTNHLCFFSPEGTGHLHDTQIVEKYSIGLIYATFQKTDNMPAEI